MSGHLIRSILGLVLAPAVVRDAWALLHRGRSACQWPGPRGNFGPRMRPTAIGVRVWPSTRPPSFDGGTDRSIKTEQVAGEARWPDWSLDQLQETADRPHRGQRHSS